VGSTFIRAISEERWQQLIGAFREKPGDYYHAATATGVHAATAKKLWLKGSRNPIRRPIQEILEREALEESRAARARLGIKSPIEERAETEAQRELVRASAINSRAREGKLVAVARENSIGANVISGRLIPAALKMAAKLGPRIEAMAEDPNLNVKSALATLHRVNRLIAMSTEIAERTMQLERLHLGQPNAIFGIQPGTDMTPEVALERLRHARDVMERAKMLGIEELPKREPAGPVLEVVPREVDGEGE
jgi:hypothetical protein